MEGPFKAPENVHRRISAPKKIPKEEWDKKEIERGEKLPDYIVRIRARVRTPEMQERYRELEKRVDQLKKRLHEAYPNPETYSADKLTDIWQRIESELMEIAAEARNFAEQYRAFNVGACVVGFRKVQRPENPWVIVFDANTKPETVMGSVRKHCAELHVTDRIDPAKPETGLPEEKMERALALFIVGEPQADDDSKVSQITLTCCKLCRNHLWKLSRPREGVNNGNIFTPETPVISANARNLGLRKLQQIKDLHRFHGELPPGHIEID